MNDAFNDLIELARRLRGTEGCPWDQSRTLYGLEEEFMEEAEEVKAAIQAKDSANLKEELGDLLYTMILMSLIAEEEGAFTFKDVLKDIQTKIISRHTWVFGKDKATTPEEALAIWAKNKKKERKAAAPKKAKGKK